ncbi:MAG: hypothetical protein QMD80_04070 [archaeon]|nr:hypothetical protein [archaeon]
MITIKDGRIWFYSDYTDDYTEPGQKHPTLDFQLISAYICPECNSILSAYFVGTTTEQLVKEYTKNSGEHFQSGSANGGSYIKNMKHGQLDYRGKADCQWQVAPGRGIRNCLHAICGTKAQIPQPFIHAIENGKLVEQGLLKLDDICNNDSPVLLYDLAKLCHQYYYLEREDHLAEELVELMQPFTTPKEPERTITVIKPYKRHNRKVKIAKGQTTLAGF